MTEPVDTARFLFDPLHDQSRAPSIGRIEKWAVEKLREPGSPVHEAASSTARALATRTWRHFISDLLPGRDRRRVDRSLNICLPFLLEEAQAMRTMAREFAIDPMSHPAVSHMAEALFAYSCFVPQLRNAEDLLERHPGHPGWMSLARTMSGTDLPRKIGRMRSDMRKRLEIEALDAMVKSCAGPEDRPRVIAGMKAALDEITDADLVDRLNDVLSRVDGKGSAA